jgi:glycosyltransferase involved in cell wall biosynthesis
VLLVRGLADPDRPSMGRFATELERTLRRSTSVRLDDPVVLSPLGLRRLDPYLARYLRAPVTVARRRSGNTVFHLTDHSDGHLAAIIPASRTVISCHDLILLRARETGVGFEPRPWSRARFAFSTSFLRRAARVVCGSEATKADVVRLRDVAPEQVTVVPYGVDQGFAPLVPEVRERLRDALGLRGPALIHVDSGQPYKNVAATLRVLARLRSSGAGAILLRVGAPLRAADRELAQQLGVEASTIELGRVSDERLVEIYNAADVLLFPSHVEGFGWPVLEAMACGTPVVTSRAAALVEVAGDAGLRADAGDVAGLAAAVSAVVSDPQLTHTLRERGLQRAAEHSWARTAEGYAEVYAAVARGAA